MANKHNLLSRLSRIVEIFQLQGSNGLTFSEVNEKLKNSFVDEDYSVSLRTFQRDLKDIESSLKIKIVYDKTKRKYILTQKEHKNNSIDGQLFAIESLKMLDIAQDVSSNNSNFIFIDKRASSGLQNYSTIKEAICLKKHLEFSYQKFNEYKADSRKLIPLALKESKKRWYVVGFEIKDGRKLEVLKTFALDRIINCEATTPFNFSTKINIKDHFNDYIGVTTKPIDGFIDKVLVQFETSIQHGRYFSTLPLHHSQTTEVFNGKTLVSLNVIPTMELVAELLAHNHEIKILQPKKLVDFVKNMLNKNLKQYN